MEELDIVKLVIDNAPIIVVGIVVVLLFLVNMNKKLKINFKDGVFELGDRTVSMGFIVKAVEQIAELKAKTHREKINAQKDKVEQEKEAMMYCLTNKGEFEPNNFVLQMVWRDWKDVMDNIAYHNTIVKKFTSEGVLKAEYKSMKVSAMLNLLQKYRRQVAGCLPDNEVIKPHLERYLESTMKEFLNISTEKDEALIRNLDPFQDIIDQMSGVLHEDVDSKAE